MGCVNYIHDKNAFTYGTLSPYLYKYWNKCTQQLYVLENYKYKV